MTTKTFEVGEELTLRDKIQVELGYVSALFMSQECKGTEIIMPTEGLIKIGDKIFSLLQSQKQQALEEYRGEIREKILNQLDEEEKDQLRWGNKPVLFIASIKEIIATLLEEICREV